VVGLLGEWIVVSSPDHPTTRVPVMAKKAIRIVATLACTECKERNYTTQKNRKNDPGRLELKKYCPRCHTHTLHRETK